MQHWLSLKKKKYITLKACCSTALNGRDSTAAPVCLRQVYLCGAGMGKVRDGHLVNPAMVMKL